MPPDSDDHPMSAPATADDRATVLLLSGPNLNLLGSREPEIYGTATLADHVETATTTAAALGLAVEAMATNAEADAVEAVHRARGRHRAIVVNPGAFTHYSWALHDALAAVDAPVVELHLSNPSTREPWRHASVVSPVADALICGLGGAGYRLAIEAVDALVERAADGA